MDLSCIYLAVKDHVESERVNVFFCRKLCKCNKTSRVLYAPSTCLLTIVLMTKEIQIFANFAG